MVCPRKLLSMGSIFLAMNFTSVFLVIILPHSVNSQQFSGSNYQVHEVLETPLHGWKQGLRLDKETILPIRIALRESNVEKMYDYVMQVSDPNSSQYGIHWSAKQVFETFLPSNETWQAVLQWLKDSGISSDRLRFNHGSGGWITLEASAKEAEDLLKTEYYNWIHEMSSKHTVGVSQNYSLPAQLRDHVDFILPTLHFDVITNDRIENSAYDLSLSLGIDENSNQKRMPSKSTKKHSSSVEAQLKECDRYTTPACLRALYGIPILPSSTEPNPKNTFGLVEFDKDTYLSSDLDLFFANYSVDQKFKRPQLISINGGIANDSEPKYEYHAESNLDLTFAMTLTNPIPTRLYQAGNWTKQGTDNIFLHAIDISYCIGDDGNQTISTQGTALKSDDCGNAPLSKVILKAYTVDEPDLKPAYENRQCNEYAKLALLGTTVISSTSDRGVADFSSECIDTKTKKYNNGSFGRFVPSFPATCPYVLSVGSTKIVPGNTIHDPESAWQTLVYGNNDSPAQGSSGGGFSNVFRLPDYQKPALKEYFAKYKPPYSSDQYNTSQNSRAFPDVSTNGANFYVPVAGTFYRISGTSASAAVIASILVLINEERLNKGLSSVGFVNPAFYANPSMFNDITNGTNPGCGTQGFSAVPGFDPVTGLGTPNYPKMLEYFLKI